MPKILFFDYSAFILMTAILFAMTYKRLAYGTSNKAFVMMILAVIFTTIFDIGMEQLIKPPVSENKLILAHIFSYGYLILRNGGNLFYIIYILVITKPVLKLKKYLRNPIIYIPYIVLMGIFVSNAFTGKVFTITEEGGYSRGPMMAAVYVISALYSLIGIAYLIKGFHCVERDKWCILFMQYPITFLALIIQFFFPFMLVEMFAMTISIVLVLILVARPEETVDPKLLTLNYNAFCNELKKYRLMKDSVSIVIIRLTNSYQVRAYLGEEKFDSYVTHIARQLDSRFAYYHQKTNIYFEQSGCFFVMLESDNFDMEHIIPQEIGGFKSEKMDLSSFGLRFDKKICTLRFPKDISDVESLLHFAAVFPEIMKTEQIYTAASDLVNTKDFLVRNHINAIIDRAINTKQLEMYYQPIYSLKEKAFVSAEALIRLKDPEFGFVPPSLFIPAAEQSSFIFTIGDFILKDVFRFISENDFKALGLKYIEINLSAAQCIQRNLSDKIFMIQDSFKIDSRKVNFEITESAYENSSEIMAANMNALQASGFSISLDDYGTGYSNMLRILNIPLSIIKLDKSLTDQIKTKKGRTVVKNTISMMHDINMNLVVEGIETKDTLDELEKMGADYIQGFYFSKPLPEKEFIEFIKKHNTGII